MKICPNCDEELDVTMIAAGVCDHCGEVFDEKEDAEAEKNGFDDEDGKEPDGDEKDGE